MEAAGVIFDLDLSVVQHVRQGMDDVGVEEYGFLPVLGLGFRRLRCWWWLVRSLRARATQPKWCQVPGALGVKAKQHP